MDKHFRESNTFGENKKDIQIFKYKIPFDKFILYSICAAAIIGILILMILIIANYYYPKKITLPKAITASSVASSSTVSSAPTDPVTLALQEYVKKNNQTIGWLKIDNTHINEPIMQSSDNNYYLRRDYTKNYNYYGSIFMDYRCKYNPLGRNTIIYGHTINSSPTAAPYKFHDLIDFKSLTFCNQNPIINLTTVNGNGYLKSQWKIFAVFTTSADGSSKDFYYIQTDFSSDNEYMNMINTMKSKSYFNFDVPVTTSDKILTLSTCAYDYTDERLVVVAKLVQNGESLTTKPATVNTDRDTSKY